MNGRFKLDDADGMLLMVTTIAAGTKISGIALDNIMEILPAFFDMFCKSLKVNPVAAALFGDDASATAHQVYSHIQRTLMAYRKDDFITIQDEPPFNRQGKANFISLLTAYNEGGKEKLRVALENVMKLGGRSSFNEGPIHFSGGSGMSMEDAVVILTSDKLLGVEAEYWYLNYTYGRIKKRGQSLRDGGNGKHYDCISFDTSSGEAKSVFFDISKFFRG